MCSWNKVDRVTSNRKKQRVKAPRDKVREAARGLIMSEVASHGKDFGSYSSYHGKLMESLELGRGVIGRLMTILLVFSC